jgi:flagellin-like hook-associated protein FlgL
MPKTRIETVQAVIDLLGTAEAGIDDAFSKTAELNAFLPRARLNAQLAPETGHDALEHAAEAIQHLLHARAAMVAAHKALAGVKTDLGLDTVNFGGLGGKPSKACTAPLAIVRAAA